MRNFNARDAYAQGLTPQQLWQRTRAGLVTRLSRDVYVQGQANTLALRADALGQLLPRHVVIGRRSAAWLWGLDVLPPGQRAEAWPVELLVPADRVPPRRPGCLGFSTDLPRSDVTETMDTRVTTVERTALDCARWLPRLEAVAALDQFLRRGVDQGTLARRARVLAGRRNARQLREVIALGDAGAASPPESWTRAIIVDAGFPRPVTQLRVPAPDSGSYFLDLALPEHLVAVEYDGEPFHSSPEDRRYDETRRAWIRRLGWEIIVVTEAEVLGDVRPFFHALADVLLSRGWKPDDATLDLVMTRIAYGFPATGR
ncbi:MAG: hypothetical protein ACRDOO_18730 [Actinomadura sp.]